MDCGFPHQQTRGCQDVEPDISTHNPEHRCNAGLWPPNTIVKLADDTTVVGVISDNNGTNHRQEVQHLADCCVDNNLVLNTTTTKKKKKEVIIDLRRSKWTPQSLKFLGIHITEDWTWTLNTN